jgi:hypothetical protein
MDWAGKGFIVIIGLGKKTAASVPALKKLPGI